MRQIEKKLIKAIYNDVNHYSNSNTVLISKNGIKSIYLHWNEIITIDYNKQKITLSSCDWQTVTTKSRLNAIWSIFWFWIYQKNFWWYITKNWKTLDFFDWIVLDF